MVSSVAISTGYGKSSDSAWVPLVEVRVYQPEDLSERLGYISVCAQDAVIGQHVYSQCEIGRASSRERV